MSEIEDKVLGRKKANKTDAKRPNYFLPETVWKVSKKGCGTTIVNGRMVYEMLSNEGKQKASKGIKRILDKDFEFERQ